MSKFSILIFDWSGVISDDRLPVYEANMRMLENHGISRVLFDEWLPNTTLTAREYMTQKGVKRTPEEIFEEYKYNLNKVVKEGIKPTAYPEAEKALKKLYESGVKMFVVSSHPEKNVLEEMENYGFKKYFQSIKIGVKDKVGAVIQTCGENNIEPSKKVAFIADTIYDMQIAKTAEVTSIAITHGYHSREKLEKENPDYIIDNLEELVTQTASQ